MEIYNRFMVSDTMGFNLESAETVLKQAGLELDPVLIKH